MQQLDKVTVHLAVHAGYAHTSGCVAGIAYYAATAYVSGPVLLVALQLLNT